MKKLITIILSLIMTFFAVPNQSADQPHVVAEKPPQSAISTTVEQVHDEGKKTAKTAFVGEVTEVATTAEAPNEETPTIQETITEECTKVSDETFTVTEEAAVKCIDEGGQRLAEYKPQIGGQPNPFENDTPTEIDDRPVEDYVGEGEDRPGEGKHF